MPKLSKWRAQHVGCQKAVDDLKADLMVEIERLIAENGRMKRALQTITSSQFKGRDWPEVYDRLLDLAYDGLGVDKDRPATSV